VKAAEYKVVNVKFGVVFPQTEIGSDPAAVRDYAQTAEGLGYDYLLIYDHVLGANPDRPGGWTGPYTHETLFHEVFVLFGYLAAITQRLELVTGVLILPQRETALVAKQAAEIDVLSGGRLRLGVGIGWNEVEYIAQGEDFHNRGKRLEEQVQILRELWTKPLVKFKGEFHTIPDAGIKPMPVQRPIPIWFGGGADIVLRRMARLGDGWMPNSIPFEKLRADLENLHDYLEQAGRKPKQFGVDVRISVNKTPQADWLREANRLRKLGVTHIAVNTMQAGFTSLDGHLDALRRFKAEMG
jgi:probable F420-dependent oxidoreductase